MTKENFEKYAELKIQISLLEKEIELLQPLILEEMPEKPVDLEGVGTFSLGSRKTWSYSSELEKIKTDLKESEKVEQQKGIAEYTEKPYLMFRQVK